MTTFLMLADLAASISLQVPMLLMFCLFVRSTELVFSEVAN
jgi:hypothetical protein